MNAADRPRQALIFLSFIVITACFIQVVAYSLIQASQWGRSVGTDEPAHIGAGLELLGHGFYGYERMHPPLARAWAALPSYLFLGKAVPPSSCAGRYEAWRDNIKSNQDDGFFRHYCLETLDYGFMDNLAAQAGRVMMWPIFLLAVYGVYRLAVGLHLSTEAAWLSAASFSTVPIIMWLGARVMTDLPFICFGVWTLVALQALLHNPATHNALWLGMMAGLAALSKFTALYFLPPICLLWLLLSFPRHNKGRLLGLCSLAMTLAAIVILIGWQFDITALREGLETATLKADKGHAGFLFPDGKRYMGEWFFYPALLLIRTPSLLLALILTGIFLMPRYERMAALKLIGAACIIMMLAIPTKVNINIHHLGLIYVPLSIMAGYALYRLYQRRIGIFITFVLFTVMAYPRISQLSYINSPAALLIGGIK